MNAKTAISQQIKFTHNNYKNSRRETAIHWDNGGVIRTMLLLIASTAKSSPSSSETRIL